MDEAIRAELEKPLESSRVKLVQVGGGRRAPHLEGWDVIAAANRIFGFDGWSYRVLNTVIAHSGEDSQGRSVALFQATVEVTAIGVSRTDVGTSDTSDDTLRAADTALKGAVTDGLKRALRTFGAQFGNELYDKDAGQREERAAQSRETSTPATPGNGNGEIRNVGDLLSWAHAERKLPRPQVLKLLGVAKPTDITDFDDAKMRILAATAVD